MDILTTPPTGQPFPKGIYIPQDDQQYLSSYLNGPQADSFSYNDVSTTNIIVK